MQLPATTRSRWPRRFVVAATIGLVPLFLFGGSVTTLGAGMAVDGWWNAEGHFMPFFPIESWFRDLATFVEHSHRQLGLFVGAAMLLACFSTFATDRRRRVRLLVVGTTLAVAFQGWLGGSRVLEDSPRFAFLHGAFAQIVFALIAACFVLLSPRWGRSTTSEANRSRSSVPSLVALLVVYVQIVLGAWYRHGLRNDLGAEPALRLTLHLTGAFVVLACVMWLVGRLGEAVESGEDTAPWSGLRRNLVVLFWTQIGLGLFAWAGHAPAPAAETGFAEWAFATAHVLVGALLLAHVVATCLWARHGELPAAAPSLAAQPGGVA